MCVVSVCIYRRDLYNNKYDAIRFHLYFMWTPHKNGVWWARPMFLYISFSQTSGKIYTLRNVFLNITKQNITKIIAQTWRARGSERAGARVREDQSEWAIFPKRTGSFVRVHWHFWIRGRAQGPHIAHKSIFGVYASTNYFLSHSASVFFLFFPSVKFAAASKPPIHLSSSFTWTHGVWRKYICCCRWYCCFAAKKDKWRDGGSEWERERETESEGWHVRKRSFYKIPTSPSKSIPYSIHIGGIQEMCWLRCVYWTITIIATFHRTA